jgi:hypothetical protein
MATHNNYDDDAEGSRLGFTFPMVDLLSLSIDAFRSWMRNTFLTEEQRNHCESVRRRAANRISAAESRKRRKEEREVLCEELCVLRDDVRDAQVEGHFLRQQRSEWQSLLVEMEKEMDTAILSDTVDMPTFMRYCALKINNKNKSR